jgi:arylsulfatase A-like enzyme
MAHALWQRTVRIGMAAGAAALFLGAQPLDEGRRAGAVTDHLLIISIDGLRPDAIAAYDAKTLLRLMAEGSYSLEAQTIFPSKTLPSHTSMLTGVGPEIHGITWNTDETASHGVVAVPTMFELARREGFETAAFFSKAKFRHLVRRGSLDHVQAPEGRAANLLATRTVEDARNYLTHRRPGVLFVHIAEPDYAGHSVGWMSFAYRWSVKRADAAVGELLEIANRAYGPGNYTVIVTADHGGHGRNHGTADDRDMTIPWITWGKGVRAAGALPTGIRTMDTAATALWLLGVPVPAEWEGRPIREAYTEAARVAADTAADAFRAAGMPLPGMF